MPNRYMSIMFHRKYFIIFIFFSVKCESVLGKLAAEKSSLAFVIDETRSMWDEIDQVKNAAKSIFNAVINSNASHIGNYVLVTFNDPFIKPALITTNKEEFIRVLDSIVLRGNPDCPEMAMKGIEEALIKSHPGSYLYVFTDASAKDYHDFPKIKSIAQKKSSQIVFVLTGLCTTEEEPAYLVYNQLAKATSGQIFHLEKGEVNKVLKYVEEMAKSPRTVLTEAEFDPGYGKTLNYTTDSKTKDVILAVTGTRPVVEVLGTNGTIANTTKIFETDKAVVVKITDTEPGTHTAKVGSETKTKAVVTGATTFNFKHGFSVLKPTSIDDTSKRPIADKLLYLAIETNDPENDVELKEVNLVDTSNNILQVLPLKKIDKDLYLTEQIIAPNTMFKILIKGFTKASKEPIERLSLTPIEPQLLADEGPPANKPPSITSVGETLRKITYGDSLELRCKVNGFPKPRIVWVDVKTGSTVSEMVEDIDLPYDYVSLLSIAEVKTNTSYECRASNGYGDDRKTVTVESITKFDVINMSKDMGILYGDEGSLNCLIDANPPAGVTWFINGAPLNDDGEIEISSNGSILMITSMHPRYEGEYICEVRNEFNRQVHSIHVTMPDKASPKLEETVGTIKAIRKHSVDINCRVTQGVPQPRVRWFFNQQNTSDFVEISEISDVLHIPIADLNNVGTYRCEAFNDYGKANKAITLTVEYPPTIKDDTKKIIIENGKVVYLHCVVDGLPPPSVHWMFNGDIIENSVTNKIYSNNTLRHKAATTNAGNYECEASNKLGSVRKTVHVFVYALPKIGKTAAEVTVRRYQSVDINCKVTQGVPQPRVRWFFKQKGTSVFVETGKISDVLHISVADLDSVGTYRCVASNDYGRATKTTLLTVEYPPTIKNDKKFIKIENGKVAYLHCEVDGLPPPGVQWMFNGDIIAYSATYKIFRNNTLRYKATINKAGEYTCEAGNKLGSVRKPVHVRVFEPPKIVAPDETTKKMRVGKSLTLSCQASGHPKPSVHWEFLKTKRKLRSTSSLGSLRLPHLQASDSGEYVCVAKNYGGEARLTYSVEVLVPPSIVKSNGIMTAVIGDLFLELPCNASGNPKPTITWKKYGSILPTGYSSNLPTGTKWHDIKTDGTLIIKNIDRKSQGLYICTAMNEVKSVFETIRVNVLQYPQLGIPKKSINLEAGTSAVINCDIPHRPTDVLTWYKGSNIIARGELTLKNVKTSDRGLYTCRVNSFSGGTSATISVSVGSKPKFLNEQKENLDFYLNEEARLVCVAEGNPTPKVSWEHNGKKLNVNTMTYIFTMLESNMGQYTCVVSNNLGKISRNFNIINTDCLLKQFNTSDSPTVTYYDVRSMTVSNIIQVPREATVTFSCPGEFTNFPGNNIEATCIQNTIVKIDGKLINASELKCDIDNIRPVIKNLKYPCGPGNTEKLKVGYNNGGEFVETYEICYDQSKAMPIYSSNRIRPSLSEKESHNVSKWYENDLVPFNYDDMYNCESQIENLATYLRKHTKIIDNCCFARKQLVNPRDVSPGLPQMVTYSNLNVVPHWSTCSSKNWDEVENRIRSLSEQANQELVVHTGIAEQPFRFRPIFLTDGNHKRQRVPEFIWKVVQNELSKSSLAIIQVNVPYLTPSQAPSYKHCKDICGKINWMRNPEWQNLYKGLVYCCAVENFENAFGFPKIFSPRMQNILFDI